MRSGHRHTWMGRIGAVAFATTVSVVAACGIDDSVVGGACAQGYIECDNQCVPISSENCGTCGTVCSDGTCEDGRCTTTSDAGHPLHTGPGDGGTRPHAGHDGAAGDDGASKDAGAHEGSTSDVVVAHEAGTDAGHAPDGGSSSDAHASSDAPGSGGDTGPACVPPYTTPAACGACGVECVEGYVCSPAADGGADAGVYACAAMCPVPYKACSGTCIDVSSDPENCGACGHVCGSGICVNDICEGSTTGDVVVIGHDYAASNILVSEATLLSNAVFLPPTNPLRVLSYEQYAVPGQVANVKATLKSYAPLGRSITYTVATDYTAVGGELDLSSFDVLLVYNQALAPSGKLATVGSSLAASISSFVTVGGDVVVLDGASGATKEMTSFLSTSNLLQASAETPVQSTDRLLVVAPGDAVGNFVISPYAPIADTVYFTTSEANGGNVTYIVDDLVGVGLVPVVIHKTPPL